MKSCDFLFIYEVKPREIESVLLLKKELERRGYSVMIEHMWSQSRRTSQINAKVAITSSALDDVLFNYVNEIAYKPQKVINLQWEQVVSDYFVETYKKTAENNALARKAVHISWGPKNKERLISLCNINENNVFIAGHVAMDFLRPEYRGYYRSRSEICAEFGLDPSKEMVLFISSFSCSAEKDEAEIDERYKVMGYDKLYLTMHDVTKRSQPKVLEWFDEILKNDDKHEFVYRPHPAEKTNKLLLDFEKSHKNFHVITDHSVKQWILTADRMYTWLSTSIVEAYMAQRHCEIIRPFEVPRLFDSEIYHNARIITDFDKFKESFFDDGCRAENFNEEKFPISEKEFAGFYYRDKNRPTYKILCDVFEEVYKNDRFIIEEQKELKKKKYTLKKRAVISGRKYASVSPLLHAITQTKPLKNGKLASVVNNNRDNRKNYLSAIASKKEMKEISRKISSVFGFDK